MAPTGMIDRLKAWPWTYIVLGVIVVALAFRVVRVTDRWMSAERGKAVSDSLLTIADSLLLEERVQDEQDAAQRVRDQFIIDSLGGVIQFQAKALGRWERTKTTLITVDTSLALEAQLANCQDNVQTLLRSGDDLSASLAATTFAADSAIRVATAAKLRADSADVRRALASDSVSRLLGKAKAATTRRWYQKLWGGTKKVVTLGGAASIGYTVGRLF